MKVKRDWLDDLFSEYIRRRAIHDVGGCERCLAQKKDYQKEDGEIFEDYKYLQCSHYEGRSAQSVRCDPDNAAGLCKACHLYFGGHNEEHRAFFIKRLGQEGFNLLQARLRTPAKYIDKEAIALGLKQWIKEYKDAKSTSM